jgi:hypothetical protein
MKHKFDDLRKSARNRYTAKVGLDENELRKVSAHSVRLRCICLPPGIRLKDANSWSSNNLSCPQVTFNFRAVLQFPYQTYGIENGTEEVHETTRSSCPSLQTSKYRSLLFMPYTKNTLRILRIGFFLYKLSSEASQVHFCEGKGGTVCLTRFLSCSSNPDQLIGAFHIF